MKPRLRPPDFRLLKAIEIAGPTASNEALAELLGRTAHGVSGSVSRLVRDGWLDRKVNGNNSHRTLTMTERPDGIDRVELRPADQKELSPKHQITHRPLTENDARRPRRCLGCGEKFESTWCGNRLCHICRNTVRGAML